MQTNHLSEQEIIRREKLAELNSLGINPYPAALYPVNATAASIKENYKGEENKAEFADVCLAGRIMSIRDMGKANFAVLQDASGKIQFYIKQDDICPGDDESLFQHVWKKLLDIGDIIGIKGFVFTTKTGETSVHVKEFNILSKALRPLPIVKEKDGEAFDEVTDPEFRYPLADRFHPARAFHAQRPGQRRQWVQAGTMIDIDVVQSDGAMTHPQLAGTGIAHIDLLPAQDFGTAVFMNADSFGHGILLDQIGTFVSLANARAGGGRMVAGRG